MARATLIHDGHPHIMDAVVAYTTDLMTLVALRATCRGMQERVDPVLFRHAELHSAPMAPTRSGAPRPPALALVLPRTCTRITTRSEFPMLPLCLSAVRNLDLVPTYGVSGSQARALTALDTLRLGQDAIGRNLGPLAPRTLVLAYMSGNDIRLGPFDNVAVPPSVERLVLNLFLSGAYDTGVMWSLHRPQLLLDPGLRARDIVFKLYFPFSPAPLFTVALWIMLTLMRAGHHRRTDTVRITVVGLDILHSPEAHTADLIREYKEDIVRNLLPMHTEDAEALFDRVLAEARFVSLADWRGELGDRADIECIEYAQIRLRRPPWEGPRQDYIRPLSAPSWAYE
ncbi:uncharacterized protein LOC62_04G005328 [Vanrija pseudolonga]|uniref:Uncharacterized protein n=1 Tax=Vanrija pseudolonga TaxID=143232 RepID=A0AAF1BM95_9TREE|nr:hypothetical protein LOC62_04G005328 [Vanrija pseudolonga]